MIAAICDGGSTHIEVNSKTTDSLQTKTYNVSEV